MKKVQITTIGSIGLTKEEFRAKWLKKIESGFTNSKTIKIETSGHFYTIDYFAF